jgi:DNA helicase HerA-like ATPase
VIRGLTYRVGQVGSFIRIPQGYQDLYGIISEVGATAAPSGLQLGNDDLGRWMRVELAGEAIGSHFERGLGQHPNIGDAVHIVTESDLRRLYYVDGIEQIEIGTLSSSDSIPVYISLDKLLTRHAAVVGSTGSGKSTSVTSIIRAIVDAGSSGKRFPAARVILIDLHGEYSSALGETACTFSATPEEGEAPLYVPYWALEAGELLGLLSGGVTEAQEVAFNEKILELKEGSAKQTQFPGLDLSSLTVDSPIPFSLKKLWYDLVDFETRTFDGPQRDRPCLENEGDAAKLIPPRYRPHAMGSTGPYINSAAKGIRRQLNFLRSRLLDKRYDFLLHPGEWEPDLDGTVKKDLDALLAAWLGHEKQVTILDLSGIPSSTLVQLIGSILRIMYDALFWAREKSEGGVMRPVLIVMEEAHRYLSPDTNNIAVEIAKRIVKEGRKYGIGAMVISQRPAEIDETILSQCGTFVALRLSNPVDRARVKGTLPDNLAGIVDLLPVLRTGEAIVIGEAARLPTRCRITYPAEPRPRSADPQVSLSWSTRRVAEGYDRVVASWRAQRTTAIVSETTITRVSVEAGEAGVERTVVQSSNLAAVGYDEATETLEIEFLNGRIYQYFNVPADIYKHFCEAGSKGIFFNMYIRNAFPCSRVG